MSLDGTSQDIVVTITGTNDAPSYSGQDLASTYHAGDSPVAIVGDNVSVSDIDSDNYAGGTLTATVIDGGRPGDTLSIVAGDHISLIVASGTTVMYDADGVGGADAVEIGTLSEYNYNSLLVTLNANASDQAVAELTKAIRFSNSGDLPADGTRTVAFTLNDGGGSAHGGHDSDYFEAHVTVPQIPGSGPVIQTDQFTVSEEGNVRTISGLYVTDTDPTVPNDGEFKLLATTAAPAQSSVDPSAGAGSMSAINATLRDGITYYPGDTNQPDTDAIAFKVTDGFGRSDTVHFIFSQAHVGGAVLNGTTGKDVILSTGYSDTLTGGEGADQFVFRIGDGSDTITDFTPGEDHIDLRAFSRTINDETIDDWLADHAIPDQDHPADLVLSLGGNDRITLKNVASLHANDFILHPGGGNIIF